MRRAAILVALLASLATAAPASAHSVMKVENGTIFYNATDDVALNRLSVTLVGNEIRFYDPGAQDGMTPAQECRAGELDPSGNPRETFCPRAGIASVRIDVGEGQDEVTVDLPLAALVVGGNGADRIVTTSGADIVNSGEGNDDVRTNDGNDAVVGGGGDDVLITGAGNDVVQGALGADTIDAGVGDDEVRVRDGVADQAACGEGNDRAQVEDVDRLTDCEAVEGVPSGGGDPGAGGDPSGGGGSGTGAPGAPGAGGGAPDGVAPRLRAVAAVRQRLGRSGKIPVLVAVSEAAEVYAIGYVEIAGRRTALEGVRANVTVGGGGTQLILELDPKSRRKARKALRRGRRVSVSLSVLATDTAGNSTPDRLPRIKLRR